LNFDLSQEKQIEQKNKALPFLPPEKIVELALDSKCRSIAYTYNEPTVFAEYALEIMKLARAAGLYNVWVTNGFMSDEGLAEILPYLDAANVDLKSSEESFYKKICGARLKPVLANLKTIKKAGVHLEITTLVIPTLSDDNKNLETIADFIKEELGSATPWHLSKFSPKISWKLTELEATGLKTLNQAHEIGRVAGLKYVYLGNVAGEKENTYCPECGSLNIERIGYNISRQDLRGRCFKCQANLNIFDENISRQK
jgi:pyruvate formate lyase activating enzyme